MATSAKLPFVGYQEIDNSGVLPVLLNGAHGVITPTLFGPTDKPYKITTLQDFQNTFGGADAIRSPFYPQIKRAFQRGASLFVQRLVASDAAAAAITVGDTNWLKASSNFTIAAKTVGSWANGVLGLDFVSGAANGGLWALKTRYAPNTDLEEVFVTPAGGTIEDLFNLINLWSKLITVTVTGTVIAPATTTATELMGTTGSDGTWGTSTPDPKTVAVNALFTNFHDVLNMDTLCALGVYTVAHAQNLITYAESREDFIGLYEIDPNSTPDEAQTLLDGDLATVNSTYFAVYFGTALTAYNSDLGVDVAGGVLMDVIGAYSYNDTVGARFMAPAGSQRGLLPNVKTFALNLLSPARKTVADALVGSGCNVIGSHPSFGPVIWGASTFNKGMSAKGPAGTVSALDAIHVRRMLIDLHENLQPIYTSKLFDPMLPKTWRAAYNKVKPILSMLEKASAIYPGWVYYGDQDASVVTDARYNDPTDLAVGKYKVKISMVPVGFINEIDLTSEVNSLLSMFNTAVSAQGGSMPSAT